MIIILLILALGAHTPLFRLLYHWLPGFDKFRGSSKFIFLMTIFLIMLAAIGLDQLIRNKYRGLKIAVAILAVGILLWCSALWLSYFIDASPGNSALWPQILRFISATGESYLNATLYRDPIFVYASAQYASLALTNAAFICLLLSLLFYLTKYNKIFIYLIALLAMGEVFIFAHNARPTFDLQKRFNNDAAVFVREHPGDYRILNPAAPNSAMSAGAFDLWGYDPGVSRRYAEFMYFTQGLNPNQANQYLNFQKIHPRFDMIRCRYIFIPQQKRTAVRETADPMPRLNLIANWQVIPQRNDIFREMEKTTFNPRKTVILEEAVPLKPTLLDKMGDISIADSSSDHLTIRVKLEQPAVLLITDSYSQGWKAVSLPGSIQHSYRIMPANYTLMAIPLLTAGIHSLRLEYKPTAFVAGKWLSLIFATIYVILILFSLRKPKSRRSLRRQRD